MCLITWACTKLCILPPSTKITMLWIEIRPNRRMVYGAECPNNAQKLIWAWGGSGWGGSGWGVLSGHGAGHILGSAFGSAWSSSMMRMKNREAQRCPRVNFSLQLKQSLRSRRLGNSTRVRRLRGNSGGLAGGGSKGGFGVEREFVGEDGE